MTKPFVFGRTAWVALNMARTLRRGCFTPMVVYMRMFFKTGPRQQAVDLMKGMSNGIRQANVQRVLDHKDPTTWRINWKSIVGSAGV